MRRFAVRLVRAVAWSAAAFLLACLLLVAVGTSDHAGPADLIVVPGNLVHGDGSMSLRLESRCERALRAWRDGLAPVLFLSGGVHADGRDEAATMRLWFLARGVPDSALVVDRGGATSWHTAWNARRWLDTHGRRGVLVVTQGFHVPRMRLACARAGIRQVRWAHSRFFERRDFYSIARELPGLAWYAARPARAPAPAPPPAPAPAPGPGALPDSTTVVMLGTGMPVPNHLAQGPATAVVAGGRLFLFDAGPGIMRQVEAAGLPYRRGPVTALFLTHLHSDHTLGYPDVIFTSWVMGRRAPLRVVGPPGTRRMTAHLVEAWREDIDVRTNGLERGVPDGWRVDVHETTGGVVYDSAGVVVRAIRVPHGNWEHAFAYRIDAPGKSVVISGDAAPSEAIEQAARDVDVLVHEVYPEVRLAPENRPGGDEWPKYMRAFHTSDRELGALAARARPRRLVLYHVVRMGGTDAELLAGVRAGGYTGPVTIARDLDRY